MGHVGISLPSDVTPNERPSRAPNCRPFKQLKVNNDIYKYSFYLEQKKNQTYSYFVSLNSVFKDATIFIVN